METIFMNTENSKTNESHKFVTDLPQCFDLKSSKKHVTLQNWSIYYNKWKNIRKQYKNNKCKIIAQTWNNGFEWPDGSYCVSDIQDYIKHIKTWITTILPIHVYINRINNRLVFKIKDGNKLEL